MLNTYSHPSGMYRVPDQDRRRDLAIRERLLNGVDGNPTGVRRPRSGQRRALSPGPS
jgi:hypothetical protein